MARHDDRRNATRSHEDDDIRYEAWRNKSSSAPPQSLRDFWDARTQRQNPQTGDSERGHQFYPSHFDEEYEKIGQHSGNRNVQPGEFGVWVAPQRNYRDMGQGRVRSERAPFHGMGPRNYVRRDERIHDEICDLLTDDGELDASAIEIEIERGEVTLSGTVPDRWSKRRAEDLCLAIRGVVDVHNRLRLAER